ncbi:MAG: PEP-CTERM sorting domain-containing protein [Verrucomicrobiales bacterium]
MNFPTGTGDSEHPRVVNLGTGYYDIEMRGWEGGGGAFWELYSAPGSFANDGDTQLWALVGQKPEVMYPGIDALGQSTSPELMSVSRRISTASPMPAALANGTPFTATGVSVINFEGNGGTGAGIFGGNTAWPGGFPGGDQTDFAMSASGALVIGEDGTYQFGFQGDDGGMLEIRDGDGNIVGFRSTSDDDNDASLVRNGQLVADYNTGNSRTVGLIDLMAGTYTINGLFWERGGGDNFEIFGAPEGAPLELLAQNGAILRTIQGGLQIAVPEPSRAFLLVLGAVALIARRRR